MKVTIFTRKFGRGRWTLGFGWVLVGKGQPVTGLALQVRQKDKLTLSHKVVFSLKEAITFLIEQDVPAPYGGKLLAEALRHDNWDGEDAVNTDEPESILL